MPSGVEVAQAYITIIPSMKGIQGTIAKELGAEKVGTDAGKKLGDGIAKGAKKSSDALMKSFGSTGDRIAFKTKTGLETAFSKAAKTAQTKMSGAASTITDKFKAVGSAISGSAIGNAFTKVSGTIRGVAQFAGEAFRGVADTVASHLAPIAERAKPIFDKVGELASAGFQKVAQAAAIGGAAAAAGIAAITKTSLDSYADNEQLWGGVQKLYGAAGQSVQEYADSVGKSVTEVQGEYGRLRQAEGLVAMNAQQAFKTAGMSANEYMEQATSFSAALIKSVNGDTLEAARLTDVAMRAMSDNVNTFGSNAQDVQNAIMGLSRENYTMLDNLKLGYAGTKDGMMQLINDSGVLGKELTSTSELADVGFGTMIEAIQKVQEQQGIAGTTAKEAAGTISGSIDMTKAAWSNLTAEMGKDDGDVPARVQELVDSALAVVENVGPRIGVIVSALIDEVPPAIMENAPKVAAALTEMLDGVTNGGFSKAVSAVKPYIDRIGTAASGLWDRLKPLAPVVQDIGKKVGGILKKGLDVATGAFEAIAPIIGSIAEHALPALDTALGVVSDAFSAAVDFLSPVASFLTDTLGAAVDWIGQRIEDLAQLVADAFGAIGDAAGAVGDFLSDPLGSIKDFAKGAIGAFDKTADAATKDADKANKGASKNYAKLNDNVSKSTANAASNANRNMGNAATNVSKQSGNAATSAEKNGQRIEKAWNRSYTTRMTATANTSSAESTLTGFKARWAGFSVTGKASIDTTAATKTLADWKYRNNNFVVQGTMNIRTNTTTTKGYMASGGIIQHKHAAGFIADSPTIISQHIVGEAGAEAVIPLTNRRYVAPFARAVADYVNQPTGGGVTVTGNTFVVRRESDIPAIGRAINQQAERQRRSKL